MEQYVKQDSGLELPNFFLSGGEVSVEVQVCGGFLVFCFLFISGKH